MNTDCFVGLFLVLVGVERWYERLYSTRALRGQRRQGWSYLALHSSYIIVFLLAAVEYFAVRRTLWWPATIVGAGLTIVATWLRITAIRTLGRFWSLQVEIRQQHQLVREGVYQYVRHPAYLAMVVEIVAVPLTVNALYTEIFAVVTFIPLLLVRLRVEETALVEKLGDAYVQYRREVRALIPRCSTARKGMNAVRDPQ
jgi:protein-S-isoprenylcysteine O-methyltransferase Ste14